MCGGARTQDLSQENGEGQEQTSTCASPTQLSFDTLAGKPDRAWPGVLGWAVQTWTLDDTFHDLENGIQNDQLSV